jgi:hypothetical protein
MDGFRAEYVALKEGYRKLEYTLHDLLKAHQDCKDKIKRIRVVCDEE